MNVGGLVQLCPCRRGRDTVRRPNVDTPLEEGDEVGAKQVCDEVHDVFRARHAKSSFVHLRDARVPRHVGVVGCAAVVHPV